MSKGHKGAKLFHGRRHLGPRNYYAPFFFPMNSPYIFSYPGAGDPIMFKEGSPYDSRSSQEIKDEEKELLKKEILAELKKSNFKLQGVGSLDSCLAAYKLKKNLLMYSPIAFGAALGFKNSISQGLIYSLLGFVAGQYLPILISNC